jgi:hypothetical protein
MRSVTSTRNSQRVDDTSRAPLESLGLVRFVREPRDDYRKTLADLRMIKMGAPYLSACHCAGSEASPWLDMLGFSALFATS